MERDFIKILFVILMAASPGMGQNSKIIKGKSFSTESRQAKVSGESAWLKGLFSYGTAEYQVQLPSTADRVKARISFKNPNKKWLKVYVYNYGTAYDGLSIRNEKLSPNWRLWEATNGDGWWESHSPKYLYTTSYDGRIDYLGPQNYFKILLFADGGIPFINDGRFLIEQIDLEYSTSEVLLPDIVTSQDAWVEGSFLLVRGRGISRSRIDEPGYEALSKISALRLARVDAYKKLALALKKVPVTGGTAAIPGSQVRSTRYISDTQAEVILEVPLASLHQKQ